MVALFEGEAVSEPGATSNFLELAKLRGRKNPDISLTMGELEMVMDYINFTPSENPNRLNKEDMDELLNKFRTNLTLYFEQRCQKN